MIYLLVGLFGGLLLGVAAFAGGVYTGYLLSSKEKIKVRKTVEKVKDSLKLKRDSEVLQAQSPEQKRQEEQSAQRAAVAKIAGVNPTQEDPAPEISTEDVMGEFYHD